MSRQPRDGIDEAGKQAGRLAKKLLRKAIKQTQRPTPSDEGPAPPPPPPPPEKDDADVVPLYQTDAATGAYERESPGVDSNDAQAQEIDESEFGPDVVAHFRDTCSGDVPLDARPALSRLVYAIEAGELGGIVVRDLERLARSVFEQEVILARVFQAGGRVLTLRYGEILPDRPGSSERARVRRAIAFTHEQELLALRERRRIGKARKRARGGYLGGHRIRRKYGYRLTQLQGRWEYVPIPSEQSVIREMLANCPDGRGYEAEARRLNAEGVPTVDGGPWRRQAVRAIVMRGEERFEVLSGSGHRVLSPIAAPASEHRRSA